MLTLKQERKMLDGQPDQWPCMTGGGTHPSREDIINHPQHYKVGGYEAKDIIKAKLTPEEWRGFLKGNVLKYMMRANYKGQHNDDCGKAHWYATELTYAIQDEETGS